MDVHEIGHVSSKNNYQGGRLFMKKLFSVLICVIMVMSLVLSTSAIASIKVKSISLDKSSIALSVGKTYNLKAVFTPANTTQKKLIYVTSNRLIATVDVKGKITAVKAGKAVITVISTANNKVLAKCNVTVSQVLKPVKLIWYAILPEQKDQEMVFAEFNRKLKDKINAEVEIRALGWGNYEEKVNTAIAAGEQFDMCWTSDWMLKYIPNVTKGAFMSIDGLLSKYAPKTKAFIDDKFWELTKVDGKLYGVPCYQIFYRQPALWIKKDIAEKYKFKPGMITTDPASLTPLLKTIKEGEKDMIPLAANNSIIGWFGQSMSSYSQEYAQNATNWEAPCAVYKSDPTKVRGYDEATITELMHALKCEREWYTQGYVRKDLLSIKDMDPEVKTGKYACGLTTTKPGLEASFKDVNGFEIVAYPIHKPELNGVTATLLAISATSRNPERTMMLIELLENDKDMYNLMCNGIEGQHYIKTGENRIKRVEDNGYQPNINWAMGNTTLAYLTPGQPDNINELVKQGNDDAIAPLLPGYTFDDSNVKNEIAAIGQVLTEIDTPLRAGVIDPEENLPIVLDRFKKCGLDKVVAEAQKQVDAYWAKRK